MRRGIALPLLVITGLVGSSCASLGRGGPPDAEERLEAAVARLDAGEYEAARQELGQLVQLSEDDEVRRKALLTLAALELDPRNEGRRLGAAASLTARYMDELNAQDEDARWSAPLARSLYLLALELGAVEERVAQAEEEARRAREGGRARAQPLPSLPGPPVTERIRALERERDQLAERVRRLEQELERIRQTLRP